MPDIFLWMRHTTKVASILDLAVRPAIHDEKDAVGKISRDLSRKRRRADAISWDCQFAQKPDIPCDRPTAGNVSCEPFTPIYRSYLVAPFHGKFFTMKL